MIRVSDFAASVLPSATLAAGAKARALRAKGVTVYDFSLGEPDFNTPAHICEAAMRAMAAGQTHYTPASGTPAARKAVADWYGRTYGYAVGPENVILSNGAKHSIHNVLVATVGPGDEVIIPTPCWVSYCDLVQMAGAMPVLVATTLESRFKMSPEQLKSAITPKTKLLMLNSPCNPTGTVYTRAELETLVELYLGACDGAVLSDEIYEALCYGDATPTCVAALKPEWRDRVVTVSGASKGYAMTGWRMGWAVAPADLVKAMDNIQSQETSCPSSVSQAALVEALTSAESPRCVEEMRQEFAARRQLTFDALAAMPGVRFDRADGAFYAFFEVTAYFGRDYGGTTFTDSAGFCAACLEQANVNLVPGSAFGAEGFARMSFACDRATLTAGLGKLAAWLASGT
jgi:aspartate aminotransferase